MKQIDEVVQKLPDYFLPEKARGISTTVQLQILGDVDEYWLVTIKDQQCKVEKKKEQNILSLRDPSRFLDGAKQSIDRISRLLPRRRRIAETRNDKKGRI